MAWDLEVVADLTDRSSEAAFALCALLGEKESPTQGDVGVVDHDQDLDDAMDQLPWDEYLEDFPSDLFQIWTGVMEGKRKLEMRTILEHVPKFQLLPARAPRTIID